MKKLPCKSSSAGVADQKLKGKVGPRHRLSFVITFAALTHRYHDAMLAQDFLIIVRAILAATIRAVNAVFGRCPGNPS